MTSFYLFGYLQERVCQDSPETGTELKKKAIDNEITCIGYEVTKAVIGSLKKSAQDLIQSGGHHFKSCYF